MNLNKGLKRTVALCLVAEATKKHALAMGKAASSLAKSWEALMRNEAKAKMPELKEKRWVDLLQSGTLVSQAAGTGPTVSRYRWALDSDWGKKRPYETEGHKMGASSKQYPNSLQPAKDALLRAIKEHWPEFIRVFNVDAGSYYVRVYYSPSFPAIPYFNHTAEVDIRAVERRKDDPKALEPEVVEFSQRAWPLVQIADDLGAKFLKIYDEAEQLLETIESILAPMKTVRQLVEQLPEAAKFLPPEPPKRQELAPKEYVDKARRMLAEGIPT